VWTSRYGSVTFNQYGREFPSGGINERGLVVELMWLDATEYPAEDDRGALPTLQWIQYQLDNAATIDEVIGSDASVRITEGGSARIHFLVADAGGGVAAVEFVAGKMVVHRGRELPYPVLTNDTYEESVAYARSARPRAGAAAASSLERFARVARYERTAADAAGAVKRAFGLLAEVAQGEYTQWSIVYDLHERRAYFRTRLSPGVRWLDLDSLAFECRTPVAVIDLNAPFTGDVSSELSDYHYAANLKLVNAAFTETPFLRDVPLAAREVHARYPESTTCSADDARRSGK
jgi:choloylglycine hydrolase